jgi:hypothetical protein
MWVVSRRHCGTTYGWTNPHVTFSSSLTQLDIIVVQITNLTDRGKTHLVHQSYFTRRKANLGILAFLGKHLG